MVVSAETSSYILLHGSVLVQVNAAVGVFLSSFLSIFFFFFFHNQYDQILIWSPACTAGKDEHTVWRLNMIHRPVNSNRAFEIWKQEALTFSRKCFCCDKVEKEPRKKNFLSADTFSRRNKEKILKAFW